MTRIVSIAALACIMVAFGLSTVSAQPTTPSPAPAMAAAPAPATSAPAAKPVPAKASKDDLATKWITLLTPIVVAIVGLVLGLVGAKRLQSERAQLILSAVKTGVESWNRHAAGTSYKWDDASSKLLVDVADALIAAGKKPLTDAEKANVMKMAEAQKKLVEPDPGISEADKPAAPKPEETSDKE